MNWFFIALISPFVCSIIHHTDKFLLDKFSKHGGVGSLVLFSTLFPLIVVVFFLIFIRSNLISISSEHVFILIVTGIMSALSLVFYFYALEEEETSVIVPMFQLIPIFGYFLGVAILKENIEIIKILAGLVVILGATILSFEFEEEAGLRFKLKPTLLMIAASLLLALNDVIFKSTTLSEGSYKVSIFWNLVGYGVFGITTLLLIKKFRVGFINTIKENGQRFISINVFNEFLQTIATLSFSYAILLAPIALVLLVDAYQPAFVFLMGIFLTRYFPKIATEKISGQHLVHKILAIAVIAIGSIFVYY